MSVELYARFEKKNTLKVFGIVSHYKFARSSGSNRTQNQVKWAVRVGCVCKKFHFTSASLGFHTHTRRRRDTNRYIGDVVYLVVSRCFIWVVRVNWPKSSDNTIDFGGDFINFLRTTRAHISCPRAYRIFEYWMELMQGNRRTHTHVSLNVYKLWLTLCPISTRNYETRRFCHWIDKMAYTPPTPRRGLTASLDIDISFIFVLIT